MALVVVTCPVCRETLELERAFLGREVECGACHRPFVAGDPDLSDAEPEVIPTTPIYPDDDDDGRPRRQRAEKAVASLAWGITSLIIGAVGLLLLPISLCCSLGILGSIVSSLGLLCGIIGIVTSRDSRGIAIVGTVINVIIFAICGAVFIIYTLR